MLQAGERVLVVDDEPEVLQLTADILQRLGVEVIKAASGPEALEKIAAPPQKVDLLIADLIMPGMTGRILADILTARIPNLKVIFMSGHIDDPHTVHADNLNFIRKPYRVDEFRSLVQTVLAKRKKTA